MEIVKREIERAAFYACTDPAWTGARHGFSTRQGGVSPAPWDSLNLGATLGDDPVNVRWNFNRFCSVIGTDEEALVKNRQVHGDLIRPVTEADILPDPAQPGVFEADGLITDRPGVCLTDRKSVV